MPTIDDIDAMRAGQNKLMAVVMEAASEYNIGLLNSANRFVADVVRSGPLGFYSTLDAAVSRVVDANVKYLLSLCFKPASALMEYYNKTPAKITT